MSVRSLCLRFATPLTAGLFMVSLVSGVALYFHVGAAWFHSMHEVLSMVLIVPVALHLWRNWSALVAYARRMPMWLSLAGSLAAAILFVYGAAGGAVPGGDPRMRAVLALAEAPVPVLAEIAHTDVPTLLSRFRDAGFTAAAEGDTPAGLAARTGRSTLEVVDVALGARP